MNKINFTKMHGCGNDYIYVNAMQQTIANPSEFAIRWSDRHKGIGSDGLVLIGAASQFTVHSSQCTVKTSSLNLQSSIFNLQSSTADFSMRIFNADGSEAMMCGNASRCIGKYLYERGLTTKTEIRLHTLSGIKVLKLHIDANNLVESVTVDMGTPIFEDDKLFAPSLPLGFCPPPTGEPKGVIRLLKGRGEASVFVSMGNPHYVIFTDDIDQVGKTGPLLERHPMFPQRCNIEFATPFPSGEGRGEAFRVRVWERGSGITQACGTGACATAVAAAQSGRAGRKSSIIMDGGTLHIEWSETDNHVYMTGPATFVFDGEVDDS